jgi:hypothetical protein
MRRQQTRAERIYDEARARGDLRYRCSAEGHVLCEHCRECACIPEELLDPTEFPNRVFRVVRDKHGRSLCRECRYQSDEMGNF